MSTHDDEDEDFRDQPFTTAPDDSTVTVEELSCKTDDGDVNLIDEISDVVEGENPFSHESNLILPSSEYQLTVTDERVDWEYAFTWTR